MGTGRAILVWLSAGVGLFALPFSPKEIFAQVIAEERVPEVVLAPSQNAKLPQLEKGVVYHTVRPGESLARLAAIYGSNVRAIMQASGLKSWRLKPGQALVIPFDVKTAEGPRLPPGVHTYTVRKGETLETIARKFGLSVLELVSANPGLTSLDRVRVGDVLFIPTGLKGRVVALGPGETLLDVARRYRVDPGELARANGVENPLALKAGDLLILPGKLARDVYAELEKKRAEERRRALERARRLREAAARRRAQLKRVAYRAGASLKGFQWPVRHFRITSYFGYRRIWIAGSNFHHGIDLAAPTGTPVYAAKSGRVIFAGWGYYYGRYVRIDHGDGVETRYAHMSRLVVRSGQYVKRGQVIGYVGASGRGALGAHLHFEVRVGGRAVNPLKYLPR